LRTDDADGQETAFGAAHARKDLPERDRVALRVTENRILEELQPGSRVEPENRSVRGHPVAGRRHGIPAADARGEVAAVADQ
jgi:hypothetical protein